MISRRYIHQIQKRTYGLVEYWKWRRVRISGYVDWSGHGRAYYIILLHDYGQIIDSTSLTYLPVTHLSLYYNPTLVDTYEEYVQIITVPLC